MTTATDPPQSPWLEAQQLRCERGDRLLFEGLDFQLSPGQVLQVEGANGSGKTSLLRMLCGLSLPTEGDIRWRGQSLQEDRAAYLEQVAYVGHNHGIKGELTALENLRFARSLGSAANGVDLEDALQRLGLAGFRIQPVPAPVRRPAPPRGPGVPVNHQRAAMAAGRTLHSGGPRWHPGG